MSPHEKELSDLEKMLAALPPRAARVQRDHVLFRAGQASMVRSRAWPFATAALSATTICLGLLLVLRPVSEPRVQIVHVQVPVLQPPTAPVSSDEPEAPQSFVLGQFFEPSAPPMPYWRMEQLAIRFGVEGLPSSVYQDDENATPPASRGPDLSAGSRPKFVD